MFLSLIGELQNESNHKIILIIAFVLLIIIGFIIIYSFIKAKQNKVIKGKIISHKKIDTTQKSNIYEIYILDYKKMIKIEIPKQYHIEDDQILTFKNINNKPRFIMLEQNIK